MAKKTTFNWTKVELKLWIIIGCYKEMTAFNWTKVELKQTSSMAAGSLAGIF